MPAKAPAAVHLARPEAESRCLPTIRSCSDEPGSNALAHRMLTARSPEACLLDCADTRMFKQALEKATEWDHLPAGDMPLEEWAVVASSDLIRATGQVLDHGITLTRIKPKVTVDECVILWTTHGWTPSFAGSDQVRLHALQLARNFGVAKFGRKFSLE